MKRAIARGLWIAAVASPIFAAGWTDRSEYDLVLTIRAEGTPQKQLALLDQWKTRYPKSDLRQVRRELYLATYQSLGDGTHMLETAKEMLAEQPGSLVGAYWCAVLIPGAKESSPELWNIGEMAARQLLARTPNSGEWAKQKSSIEVLAHRALGWIQWQRGNYAAAEAEFAAALEKDKTNAELSGWYGLVLASQNAPEKITPALWQLARAGALKDQGALPAVQKRQLNALVERVYVSYHGDPDGLEQLRAASLASFAPAADFKVESGAAIAARRAEEDLKRTNPQLAAWMALRKQLEGPDGEKFFAESVHLSPLPKLKGTVIRCTPETRPTEIVLGLSNGVTPEVLLKVSSALPMGAEPGTEIEFEGTADSFLKTPFQVTVLVDKTKIDGWPAARKR